MANGRIHIASLEQKLVTGTSDLFELVPNTTTFVEILEFHISQENLVRDVNSDIYNLKFIVDHTISGDNSAGINISSMMPNDNLFIGTIYKNFNVLASGGSPKIYYKWDWINRIPFSKIFTPETNRIISPGQRMVIRISDITKAPIISALLIFREYGGTKRIFVTLGLISETDTTTNILYVRLASETDTAFAINISGGA